MFSKNYVFFCVRFAWFTCFYSSFVSWSFCFLLAVSVTNMTVKVTLKLSLTVSKKFCKPFLYLKYQTTYAYPPIKNKIKLIPYNFKFLSLITVFIVRVLFSYTPTLTYLPNKTNTGKLNHVTISIRLIQFAEFFQMQLLSHLNLYVWHNHHLLGYKFFAKKIQPDKGENKVSK